MLHVEPFTYPVEYGQIHEGTRFCFRLHFVLRLHHITHKLRGLQFKYLLYSISYK
jgi:hypothetical protein